MEEETYSLFWGGIYSQWALHPFTFYDMEFNCNEQMMMYAKAITFYDTERAAEVMRETDPKKQKALGRRVRNFDFGRWNTICNQVVYTANFCKFTQNAVPGEYLMADPSSLIVEASPYDKVWGIGLGVDDPRAKVREEWLGENRLGQAITDVRQYLRDPSDFDCEHNKRISDTVRLFDLNGIILK